MRLRPQACTQAKHLQPALQLVGLRGGIQHNVVCVLPVKLQTLVAGIGAALGRCLLLLEPISSDDCMLFRHHLSSEVVSWTGSFTSRRPLLGLNLHWSYAPAEVKVLTSADGGNYEEATGWRRISRSEPSFEETVMFAGPITASSVMVLMRGAKPWGYFGLAQASGLSGPYSFMLVSGAAAAEEQCVVTSPVGELQLEGCLDGIVAGDGREVFSSTESGQLQTKAGLCVVVHDGKLAMGKCEGSQTFWDVTADGQVKQGNMCFVVTGATIAASDCDEAAAIGGDKFFQVAVPASDPTGPVAVQAMGELLRASSKRQRALLGALQSLLPKLASCKAGSFANMEPLNRAWSRPALLSKHQSAKAQGGGTVSGKVAEQFGVGSAEIAQLLAESAQSLQAMS